MAVLSSDMEVMCITIRDAAVIVRLMKQIRTKSCPRKSWGQTVSAHPSKRGADVSRPRPYVRAAHDAALIAGLVIEQTIDRNYRSPPDCTSRLPQAHDSGDEYVAVHCDMLRARSRCKATRTAMCCTLIYVRRARRKRMGAIGMVGAQAEVAGTESQSACGNIEAELALLDKVPAVRVAISSLMVADSPRRSGENREHVQALANAQGNLPPIVVHRASMRVLDGLHRIRAAELRGQNEIEVRFFHGDELDAFVLAVRLNIAHGLPLSLVDRKAAATRIIAAHPQWSDRLISSVTGLATGTIAETRGRSSDGEVPPADIRIGLDGRGRPVNGAERRRNATKLLIDDPSLSLRQVAKIAGISPETARDVRSRLEDKDNSMIPPRRSQLRPADHDSRDNKRQGYANRAALGNLNQVMRQLKSDPTLRFTETGRTLLRLLDVHALSGEKWAELCDNVPAHCKGAIANAALGCAEVWRQFSERLMEQDNCNTA